VLLDLSSLYHVFDVRVLLLSICMEYVGSVRTVFYCPSDVPTRPVSTGPLDVIAIKLGESYSSGGLTGHQTSRLFLELANGRYAEHCRQMYRSEAKRSMVVRRRRMYS
jgi:hypothetical protein